MREEGDIGPALILPKARLTQEILPLGHFPPFHVVVRTTTSGIEWSGWESKSLADEKTCPFDQDRPRPVTHRSDISPTARYRTNSLAALSPGNTPLSL